MRLLPDPALHELAERARAVQTHWSIAFAPEGRTLASWLVDWLRDSSFDVERG
jgi:hypothetical protein